MFGPDAETPKDRMRVHTRLAATISRSFASASVDEVDEPVVDALRQVAATLAVDVAFLALFDDEHIIGVWRGGRRHVPGQAGPALNAGPARPSLTSRAAPT